MELPVQMGGIRVEAGVGERVQGAIFAAGAGAGGGGGGGGCGHWVRYSRCHARILF